MGQRIDQFCENLRIKLTNIDDNMVALKANLDSNARNAEQDVRNRLIELNRHIDENRAKVAGAQAEIKKWAEERKAATSEKIAHWKAKLEVARLQTRAEAAEAYANAATIVAMAAIDSAEQASLEAWMARKDAESAQGERAA